MSTYIISYLPQTWNSFMCTMARRLIKSTIYIMMRHVNLRVYHPYRPFSSPILGPYITQEFQYLPFITPRTNYRSTHKQEKRKNKRQSNNCVTGLNSLFINVWIRIGIFHLERCPTLMFKRNSGSSSQYIKQPRNH